MNGDEAMNTKKEQEVYVVADYFFDSAAVNMMQFVLIIQQLLLIC